MPARNTQPAQAMRRSLAPSVLCDITNTNTSFRNPGNKTTGECTKPHPGSGIAGLVAAAGAGCGACCNPPQAPQQTVVHGDTHIHNLSTGSTNLCWNNPSDLMDIDDEDAMFVDDPQSVAEYVQDIYGKLNRDEANCVPRPEFLETQNEINTKMRSILVDWLIEVHLKYKMKSETLFLTVNIIDRFLEKKNVTRKSLQLAGVASMLIAAKYEEIYPPEIKDFVYITDNAYTRDDILKMEMKILITLNFVICCPTIGLFLERYQRLNQCEEAHQHLVQYLAELSLVDHKMMRYTPSHLAAAATLLSNKLLKRHPAWPPVMVKHTKQTEPSIKACARDICSLLEASERSSLQAVRKKFSQSKFCSVSKMSF